MARKGNIPDGIRDILIGYIKRGFTDTDIAVELDVSISTIGNWRRKLHVIREPVGDWESRSHIDVKGD